MRLRITTTRALQIGLLFLLLVCLTQVLWWTLDQALFTSEVRDRYRGHYEADVAAARVLLDAGMDERAVAETFPHLEVDRGNVRIRPEALESLASERFHRLNRYGWEGSFFFAVLVVSMAVLWRTLRQEARLRRRQQNFIAAVSHEFKSPLASLQLSAETMAMRELGPERRQVLVERILDDVRRMEDMASKILNTSRLEDGRIELNPEPLSLAQTVATVVDGLQDRAVRAGVRVETEVPAELLVRADPMATRTVVKNLVENAVKATAAAGGGRVTLHAEHNDGRVALEVRDDGIGFAPEERHRLFRKFYRPGDELRRTSTGTGLGLFIVDRLMHHQKGRASAHSDGPGKGAVFTVWWPVAPEMDR